MTPEIRVVRGVPTADEVAALVAVLCARPPATAALTGYDAWRAQRLRAVRDTGRPGTTQA